MTKREQEKSEIPREGVIGAVVTGIDLHPRKAQMYRITLELEIEPSDGEPVGGRLGLDADQSIESFVGQTRFRADQTKESFVGRTELKADKAIEWDTNEADEEEGAGTAGADTGANSAEPEPEEEPGDWNDEVDALIAKAKAFKRLNASQGDGVQPAEDAPEDGAELEGLGGNNRVEAVLTVHEDTLVSWRLLKGRRLSAEETELLRQEEQKEEAYRSALWMLEFKARTTAEITRALKRKGYPADVAKACMERLRSRGMLDDAAYAKRYAEQKASGQRKGRMLIRQELMQRGVGRQEIDRAIDGLDGDAEQEAALALARKKWPSTKGNDRERQMKLMGMLLRRGYPSGVARTAVRQASEEAGERDTDDYGGEESFYEPREMDD